MAKKKPPRQYSGTPDERLVSVEFDVSKRTSQKARSQNFAIKTYDVTGEILRRRKAVTLKYLNSIKQRYEKKYPELNIAQTWARYSASAFASINLEASIHNLTLAAAIWILDELKHRNQLKSAYKYFYKDPALLGSFYVPLIFDAWHDISVIQSMMYLIIHRDDMDSPLKCYINDVTASRTKPFLYQTPCDDSSADELNMSTRDRFNAIMAMLHPDVKQWAVERFEAKQWEYLDLFFDCCGPLSAELAAAEQESARLIEEGRVLQQAADEERRRIATCMPKMPFAFSAPVAMNFSPTSPFSMNDESALEEILSKLRRIGTRGLAVQDQIDDLLYQEGCLYIFATRPGTMNLEDARQEGLRIESLVRLQSFEVDDPYETCFAFLYLLDSGSDSAWLYNTSMALLSAAARKLPWGPEMFVDDTADWDEGDVVDDEDKEVVIEGDDLIDHEDTSSSFHYDPLSEPAIDWNQKKSPLYQLKYKDLQYFSMDRDRADSRKLNLPQVVFACTRLVMPRTVSHHDGAAEDLIEAGMDPQAAAITELYLQLADDVQYPSKDWEAFLQSDRFHEISKFYSCETPEEESNDDFEDVEDTAALQEQIRSLKKKNDDLRQMLHTATKEADQNKAEAHRILSETANEHQELLDLRELVFNRANQENQPEEEPTNPKVNLPYTPKRRIIAFGGHDSWLKAIKPLLPDVTFFSREQIPNTETIRCADTVWIQANALSHKFYYKIINIVRTHRIPVRYFGYASARKCAEQLVLDDMKQ